MALPIYLVVFLTVYFLAVFALPSLRVWRRTGVNPWVFGGTDSPRDFLGRVSGLLVATVYISALLNLFAPWVLRYFGPFVWLEIAPLRYAGLALMHLALPWAAAAQAQMGDSWRIGIDAADRTDLRTGGLFSVSRNPVFLGLITALAGFFLVLPNALTLLLAVVTALLLQVQVRLEEEYLSSMHGQAYAAYSGKVPRWF